MTWRSLHVVALLLATLAMRLAVPAGYMLDTSGGHGVAIVPCFGTTAQTAATPHHHAGPVHHHPTTDRSGEEHNSCPFTSLDNASSPPPAGPALAPVEVAAAPVATGHSTVFLIPGRTSPRPPSTGPPRVIA